MHEYTYVHSYNITHTYVTMYSVHNAFTDFYNNVFMQDMHVVLQDNCPTVYNPNQNSAACNDSQMNSGKCLHGYLHTYVYTH